MQPSSPGSSLSSAQWKRFFLKGFDLFPFWEDVTEEAATSSQKENKLSTLEKNLFRRASDETHETIAMNTAMKSIWSVPKQMRQAHGLRTNRSPGGNTTFLYSRAM